ncbi:hypothetical protein J6590_070674 [Homalodisca vitripennis]|nr:hypothetical protein J6590_070674 [Homalodisca vitripennis]
MTVAEVPFNDTNECLISSPVTPSHTLMCSGTRYSMIARDTITRVYAIIHETRVAPLPTPHTSLNSKSITKHI